MARKNQFILRNNSSLDIEISTFVVQKYGELKHTTLVRRAFATKFHPKCPRKVPQLVQFEMLKSFEKTGTVHHTALPWGEFGSPYIEHKRSLQNIPYFSIVYVQFSDCTPDLSFGMVKKVFANFLHIIFDWKNGSFAGWCSVVNGPVFSNLFNNLSNYTSCGTFLGHFG